VSVRNAFAATGDTRGSLHLHTLLNMNDVYSQAVVYLDTAGDHLDAIPPWLATLGVSLFVATIGDDVRDKYMLHFWVCPKPFFWRKASPSL
jgi:hypothetical protein